MTLTYKTMILDYDDSDHWLYTIWYLVLKVSDTWLYTNILVAKGSDNRFWKDLTIGYTDLTLDSTKI